MEEEFILDTAAIQLQQKVNNVVPVVQEETPKTVQKEKIYRDGNGLINCLSNTKVIVKYLPQKGTVDDPKHVMYGGLAEGAHITITVPKLRSGVYKNVLTDSEKEYLEYIMGLDVGALNVYNRENNFWSNNTDGGVSFVRLTKLDTILDLSSPIDYIKYKILLANSDLVAPNQQELQDRRKATYRFVLITENEVNKVAKTKLDLKRECFFEFGKIAENTDILRMVVETITSKPVAKNSSVDYLQTICGDLIDGNPKLFYSIVKDPLLKVKVLIKNCVEQGFISKRGDFYYLRSDNSPLCEGGEDPVLSNAAKYLSNPKRQEMKFALEAKLKE